MEVDTVVNSVNTNLSMGKMNYQLSLNLNSWEQYKEHNLLKLIINLWINS